jgi:hypothetical protein
MSSACLHALRATVVAARTGRPSASSSASHHSPIKPDGHARGPQVWMATSEPVWHTPDFVFCTLPEVAESMPHSATPTRHDWLRQPLIAGLCVQRYTLYSQPTQADSTPLLQTSQPHLEPDGRACIQDMALRWGWQSTSQRESFIRNIEPSPQCDASAS